ncbi:MAG: GldG family protein [Planctomycetes bacterium]|nr:GldG family protein [Planctomycetota bacterium]
MAKTVCPLPHNDHHAAGFVGGAVLRLVLLFVVLAEVAFLASRYRARADLTQDRQYTLTESTQKVLGKLEDRLVIEAYFSPDEDLPVFHRPYRVMLRDALKEYEEIGRGHVRVVYFNPFEDRTLREKAERLGMKPQEAQVRDTGSLKATEVWQGLRLRYGAKKESVIPFLQLAQGTYFYESVLTPRIKQLTVQQRPKIGVLASRTSSGGMVIGERRTPAQGFTKLLQAFGKDYDLEPLDISKGQLVRPEVEVVLLLRPKNYTDRIKFILDQFLMRGGKLVVFADACEVEVREDRELRGHLFSYDGPGETRFLDQLRTYGVKVEHKVVGEGVRELQQTFGMMYQDPRTGQGGFHPFFYPYNLQPAKDDWAARAEAFAQKDGKVDQELAAQYKKLFKPGCDESHDLIKAVASVALPGLFWPCPVDLVETMPKGVTGKVLLRTSPLGWTEMPNIDLDPFQGARDPRQRMQNLERWTNSKGLMRPLSNPTQIPLAVFVEGTFSSYFADKPVPPAMPKKKDEAKGDPDKWDEDPKAKKDDKVAGPTKPKPKDAATAEPAESKLRVSKPGAQLLVIGDATFLRDDFAFGNYAEMLRETAVVGPADRGRGQLALLFFRNLLDWLVQERDLLALRNKSGTDRRMKLLARDEAKGERTEDFVERLQSREKWLQRLVSFGPGGLLCLFGLLMWLRRSAQKRAFLNRLK